MSLLYRAGQVVLKPLTHAIYRPAITGGDNVPRTGGRLLYTSDAADERSSGDLGGRRIIKKKKHIHISDIRRRYNARALPK